MTFPEKFELGGQVITIRVEDIDEAENRFGYYNSVKEEIVIFKHVNDEEDKVELSESQLMDTLLHEVFHSFQYHSKGETSEAESATYASFMTQFLKSSGLKLV